MGHRGAARVTTTDPSGSDGTATDATAVLPPTGGGPPHDADVPADEPAAPEPSHRARRVIIEWALLIAAAVTIAVLLKTFLVAPFYIPSESMEPTLYKGDRILVNRLSYDFHDVNRGDVIVFEAPKSAQRDGVEDFVKRVIGLAGETVTYSDDGAVLINGHRLKEPYLRDSTKNTVKLGVDVPPNCGAPPDGEPGCVVPKDHIFVMGDNRTSSSDGRVFGAIPESSIIGRVFLRIWPPGDIGFF
jgi:signal peptidase I